MQVAPFPADEALRVKNLLTYDILDTPEEESFDDLVELIAQVSNCQYALIAFIDTDRHWFKAKKSIDIREVPRDTSFCSHTILQDDVMIVKNAKKDNRFLDSPYVNDGYNISFYAGAPIISAAGYKIGAVCAMDQKQKKTFTPKQKNALKIIAHQVTVLLDLKARNKQIAEQSNKLAEEEKRMVQLTVTGQDEEKNFIAYQLHENFAQSLAGTKLYLDSAEHSKKLRIDFIKKSKSNILQVIEDLKALSKAIVPSTFEHSNYLQIIEEMLNEYGRLHNKAVLFRQEGEWDHHQVNTGLTLFRVVENQLKYAHKNGAQQITVTIQAGNTIRLQFVDDGKIDDTTVHERKLLLHQIKTRVDIMHGTVSSGLNAAGNNLLEVELNAADA